MNTSTMDETALLLAARKGDRTAFGALVKLYQRRAYAAAFSIVGNSEDALEIAQEAFVRAFRAMHRFDPKMPFYPWLYRIIRNICYNHLRRRSRHGEISLQEMMENGYDPCDNGRTPEEHAELDDLKRSIRGAMAQLTPEHREILRLRHFLELSYAEIAECLKIPQGTVMSRLHAARKALRQVIETKEEELVHP
ncbi:MAG: sigma-70 family RNA polymerase sigma factor [Candidatus Hydrogenedentes bacterium]|nr:sigma-70 family RNA polymerase sigma factor [Candidatus Hydrogenedentota bacterium]